MSMRCGEALFSACSQNARSCSDLIEQRGGGCAERNCKALNVIYRHISFAALNGRPCEAPASFSIDAEAFATQAAVDVVAKTIHLFVMVMTLRTWSGG
jgi:hypothetical protein